MSWVCRLVVYVLCMMPCIDTHSLSHMSYLQLPTELNQDTPLYSGLNRQAAISGSYDSGNKILYVIGQHLLHVVDVSNLQHPQILLSQDFPVEDGQLTALDICNGQLAVSFSAQVAVEPGKIVFFKTFMAGENITDLTELKNVTVGAYPKHVKYIDNCNQLIVLNAGESGLDSHGQYQDPEGTVSIIAARGTSSYVASTINFQEYDYGAKNYNPHLRVPSMYIPTNILATPSLFSRDAQPDYTTVSSDGQALWVTLPKNNAIAKIDIVNGSLLDVIPLPLKDWSRTALDASDDDGGVHRRPYSGLLSLRQPTVVRLLSVGTASYITTAETGAITAYTKARHGFDWSDATLASKLVIDRTQEELKANAGNLERLGRLQVSHIEGKNFFNEEYRNIAAFGGRGVSIWDPLDLSKPVYDTGGEFESYMEYSYKSVFNCDYNAAKETYDSPENLRDTVSDNMGGQVTGLDVKEDANITFMVAGTSSTGTLLLYTIDKSSGRPLPVFQHIYRSGQTDLPWRDLYRSSTAGDLYITDIGIIPSKDSPDNRPLVYVISKGSGSLSLYEILS